MKNKVLKVVLLCGAMVLTTLAQSQNNNLKINKLQVIGSHNSYKQAIDTNLFAFLAEKDSTGGIYTLQYEHLPITEQLSMGLRNLELDVYSDKEGGKFAHPKGLDMIKDQPEYDPQGKMNQPGFKMLHVLDIDFRSEYYLFSDCLSALKKWSEENPNHEPVFITLEPKDGDTNRFGTTPEPFTSETYEDLDAVILTYLGKEHLITPDDVRGNYATLESAVLKDNWPTLKNAKGKYFFILDAKGEKRDLYIKNHPSLKGRVIFTNSEAGTPEAAAMILNNPEDERIPELVKKGYIIRTRADANTHEAREEDYTQFEAAKKSGAQIITTDYYVPSKLFKSTYHISFDDGGFVRINPVNGKQK